MLKFLSQLFKTTEGVLIELDQITFFTWLEKEIAQSDFAHYLPGYFQQISQLRQELQDKVIILREREIPEEHKNVDPRVKTIVLGNKEHYLRALSNLAEKIVTPLNLSFTSLEDFQKARDFNQEINQNLDQFSHFTEKSYHTTKHLFYEEVDEIFKVLKEINNLVQGFEQKSADLSLMEKIKQTFAELIEENNKKKDLLKEIKEAQETLKKISAQEKKSREKEKELLESKDYKYYLNLKDEEQELQNIIEEKEREVHAFLFKLSKPLKKFQYSANDKIIESYLTDSVKAFHEDEELKIISILESLKESLELRRITFEDKLQKNYLEQIQGRDKLKEIKIRINEEMNDKEQLTKEIASNHTAREIEELQSLLEQLAIDIPRKDKELLELQQRLQKINLTSISKEISDQVNKVFRKKITIII